MRHTLLIIASGLVLASTQLSAQAPATAAAAKLLPGTRGSIFSSIQGNAVNSSNGPLMNTVVRLRDARYGHIVERVMTDKQGAFAFRSVDPGNYVVEIMNPANDAVLFSSPMLNVGAGETVSALVKMPFHIPMLAGLIGSSQTTASAISTAAQAVTAAAASSNTVAETLVGAPATTTATSNGH